MTLKTCFWHPLEQTLLSCGRCGKSICLKCMRHHVVGIRCKDCENFLIPPKYRVTLKKISLSLLVAIGTALTASVFLLTSYMLFGMGLLTLALSIGLGYFSGHTISVAVRHHKGKVFQSIAAGSMILGFTAYLLLKSHLFGFATIDAYDVIGVLLAVIVAPSRLRG